MGTAPRLCRWPAPALLAAFTLACNDATDSGTLPQCAGAVSVAVGSGTTPAVTWSPACRLFLVLIEDPTGTGDQWGILSDSSNAITAPVQYGTVPPGATKELLAPTPLQSGHEYRVSVFRFVGPGHEDGELIGQKAFTP